MKDYVDKHNARPRFFMQERTIFQRSDAKLNEDGTMSMGMNFPVCVVHEFVKEPNDVLEIMNRGLKSAGVIG